MYVCVFGALPEGLLVPSILPSIEGLSISRMQPPVRVLSDRSPATLKEFYFCHVLQTFSQIDARRWRCISPPTEYVRPMLYTRMFERMRGRLDADANTERIFSFRRSVKAGGTRLA